MRPTPVREPLATVLKRADPEQRLRPYKLWTFWDEVVGEEIAARANPVALRAGVLTVAVNNHTWMQELQFMRAEIVQRLNARLGEPLIDDLFLIPGTAPENRNRSRTKSSAQEPPARRPAVEIPEVRDPRLAATFRRLAELQARRGR